MIGIIDYGMGNLTSVKNALDFIGADARIEPDPARFSEYAHLILPGVGAYSLAMQNLRNGGMVDGIMDYVHNLQRPFLGICLGMQLLFDSSTEHGFTGGLSLIGGTANFLGDEVKDLAVPHMGWNNVVPESRSQLLKGLPEEELVFYFVHSYHCLSSDPAALALKTVYGKTFDSIVEKDNIFACQFHPEKSQKSGLTLLKNFTNL